MASIKKHKSTEMGMHDEVLTGRTQQVFLIQKRLKISFITMPIKLTLIKEQKLMQII